MQIITKIKIKNYRNLEDLLLEEIQDLNILIGPTNCGKTQILNSLNLLNRIKLRTSSSYWINDEKSVPIDTINDNLQAFKFLAPYLETSLDESHFREARFEIVYYFNPKLIQESIENNLKKNEKQIFEIIKNYSEKIISIELRQFLEKIFENENGHKLTLKQDKNLRYALSPHLSHLLIEGIFEKLIQNKVVLIEDARIERYKKTSLKEYLENKNLSGEALRKLIEFLKEIVDPSIKDYKQKSLDLIKNNNFITSIEEQGSGVKSLICVAADILSSEKGSIILLDEPELGLNPFAKQEFLKFLFKESENKQIFIATHDPTFVNPILWESEKVSVYSYSVMNGKFLRIDLRQAQQNPNIFAGYLPHTVSLKDIHFYVEGTSDVYIFQILLRKYLEQETEVFEKENRWEILNKIGIFHLAGDYWEHLLYTIPKPPYKCIVILDGNKKEKAKEVIQKYDNALVNTAKFEFCQTINDIGQALDNNKYPVYCLKEKCIEKYLFPDFNCKNPPPGYNKKINGPQRAEKMEKLPDEIRELFATIFGTIGIGHIKLGHARFNIKCKIQN